MPVLSSSNDPNATPGALRRRLYVTDRDGVTHEIKTKDDLDRILAQMTPQELEDWKTRYRFTPISNGTDIKDYTGTISDLL